MFGIGVAEMIIIAVIGLFLLLGGVAALVVISLALTNRNKPNQD